jgi:hypothetical protein
MRVLNFKVAGATSVEKRLNEAKGIQSIKAPLRESKRLTTLTPEQANLVNDLAFGTMNSVQAIAEYKKTINLSADQYDMNANLFKRFQKVYRKYLAFVRNTAASNVASTQEQASGSSSALDTSSSPEAERPLELKFETVSNLPASQVPKKNAVKVREESVVPGFLPNGKKINESPGRKKKKKKGDSGDTTSVRSGGSDKSMRDMMPSLSNALRTTTAIKPRRPQDQALEEAIQETKTVEPTSVSAVEAMLNHVAAETGAETNIPRRTLYEDMTLALKEGMKVARPEDFDPTSEAFKKKTRELIQPAPPPEIAYPPEKPIAYKNISVITIPETLTLVSRANGTTERVKFDYRDARTWGAHPPIKLQKISARGTRELVLAMQGGGRTTQKGLHPYLVAKQTTRAEVDAALKDPDNPALPPVMHLTADKIKKAPLNNALGFRLLGRYLTYDRRIIARLRLGDDYSAVSKVTYFEIAVPQDVVEFNETPSFSSDKVHMLGEAKVVRNVICYGRIVLK